MRCSCGRENPNGATRCPQCGRTLIRPRDLRRIALDVAAAVALAAVLALVWAFDPGSPSGGAISTDVVDAHGDGRPSSPSERRSLRLAVTPPEYDDMGKLLATLGSGYQFTEIPMDDLLEADKLAAYDVNNFDANVVRANVDWTPDPLWFVGIGATWRDIKYKDNFYGRNNDHTQLYDLTVGYGNPDKFQITLLGNYGEVKFDQARNVTGTVTLKAVPRSRTSPPGSRLRSASSITAAPVRVAPGISSTLATPRRRS